MPELVIERHFNHPVEKVFAFVTQREHLLGWWGPETVHIPEGDLALDRPGPWSSVMQGDSGERYPVAGEVQVVEPPRLVRFTWAWQNAEGDMAKETLVEFHLDDHPDGGTLFRLRHSGFANEEVMGNHESGWSSSLRKLDTAIGSEN